MLYDKLYPAQRKAADWAYRTKTAAIFGEQGSGKTWIAAALIERLLQREPSARILLVVPLGNKETTWGRLLRSHSLASRSLTLLHHERLHLDIDKLAREQWSMVIIDESQKIKARGSKVSRAASRLAASERKVLLTGTPFDTLTNDPQQLWAQFRFLRPSLFGRNWQQFSIRFCYKTGYMGYETRFTTSGERRFLRLIEPYVLRLKKADVFDLKALRTQVYYVDLDTRSRKMYDSIERDMLLRVGGLRVTTGLRITQLAKLDQICGGFVIDDEHKTHPLGREKLRAVHHLLSRVTWPVVIFCRYLEEVDMVSGGLTCRVATLTGRNRKDRTGILDEFQHGRIDVLVAQQRTGGVAVDLFRSHTAIFYSLTYSSIDYDQAVSRLHRGGQTEQVNVWVLVARDTIDEAKYQAVTAKVSVMQAVLEQFRRRRVYL